jgi:predicted metal-dependent peptidase
MASKLEKAKAQVILDSPFWASILLRRKLIRDDSIPTFAVDAHANIYYNEAYVESLTVPQIVWGLCHEVGHVICQHALRKGIRNHKKWNYAGDAWINDTLDDSNVGQRIPNTVDIKGSKDKTTETIYDELPDNPGENGLGEDVIYGVGAYGQSKPITSDETKEIEAQIKIEIAEAAQAAKMRGKLSGKLADLVAGLLEVKTPWYEILEKHMTACVSQGQSWRRPNRRFFDHFLPSVEKLPQMGELVVQIDVSGSISKTELDYYNGHLSRIIEECRPEKVHVLYTDTEVQKHCEFECGEDVQLEFYSGGGTDMNAGFDYLTKHSIEPQVFVCFTDGHTVFGEDPGYYVVWCISSDVKAPWGQNIKCITLPESH